MAKIVQRGQSFGGAIGAGLGRGLEMLAQSKLDQMSQGQQSTQALNGLGQQEEQGESRFGEALSLLGEDEQDAVIEEMLRQSGTTPEEIEQQLIGTSQLTPEQEAMGIPAPPEEIPFMPKREAPAPKKPKKKDRIAEILRDPNLTTDERLKLANIYQKERFEKRKISKQEEKEARTETKEFYKNTLKTYRASVDNNARLNRMEKLIQKGKLPFAGFESGLTTIKKGFWGVGIDLGWLLHPDATEFEKLSTDFIKNLKDIFGGRITNTEMENFLKTIPTLAQTDEGKRRVIENLRIFNDGSIIRKNAMAHIIKQNNGKRPLDLEIMVEELAGPALDKLSSKMGLEAEKRGKKGGSWYSPVKVGFSK